MMNKDLQNKNSGYKELKEKYSADGVRSVIEGVKGDVLKKSREDQGLSLDTVHDATKVPLDVLKGIEQGYKIGNVSSYYIKGFVKIYAKYLGVDIQEVIQTPQRDQSLSQRSNSQKEPFLDIDLKQWTGSFFNKKNKQKIVLFIVIILSIWSLGKVFSFVSSRLKDKKRNAISSVTTPKKEKGPLTSPGDLKKDSQKQEIKKNTSNPSQWVSLKSEGSAPQSSKKPSAVAKDMVVAVVRATSTGWIRVEVDGKVFFQGTLRKGDVETWTAKEKVEISGRYIGKLEFEINGKLIGSLGREDRQAKTVIITKNGLSVTK